MTDRLDIPLKVGDLVYDYTFNLRGKISVFEEDYVRVFMYGTEHNYYTIKQVKTLISLEPHKELYPELFL